MIVSIPVREVMESDVATVSPEASAREVARSLHERDAGSLVVTDDDGTPVGIVADSDLIGLVATGEALSTPVGSFMSTDLVTVAASDPIEVAARRMKRHDFDQLPVLDAGDLVGVVSVRHLSYYLPRIHLPEGQAGPTSTETREWEFEYHDEAVEGLSVGDEVTFSKELSPADVRSFAAASGDTNPLHLDEAYAEKTRFGRRIVHGVLALGVVSAALARLPGLVIYLSQTVQFVAPVELGETVTARCKLVEELGHARYRLQTTVLSGDGEPVVEGEATVLIDSSPVEEERPADIPQET